MLKIGVKKTIFFTTYIFRNLYLLNVTLPDLTAKIVFIIYQLQHVILTIIKKIKNKNREKSYVATLYVTTLNESFKFPLYISLVATWAEDSSCHNLKK